MVRSVMLLALVMFASSAFAEPPEGYPFMKYDKAMQQARAVNKPIFIYFGRYGCGYCDKTNKEAFVDSQVRKRYTEHYVLAYVDSESGRRLRLPSGERITERELGTRYNAFVTPVFSFTTADGTLLHRMIGVQSIKTLLDADTRVQKLLQKAGSH